MNQTFLQRTLELGYIIAGAESVTVTGTPQVIDLKGKQAIIFNNSAAVVYIDTVTEEGAAKANTTTSFPIPVGATLSSVTGKFSLVAASGNNNVRLLIVDSEALDQ